jgi:hypothetical protein
MKELNKERTAASKLVDKELRKHQYASRKVLAREEKKAETEERKRERKEKKPEKSESVYRVRITIEVPTAPLAVPPASSLPDSSAVVSAIAASSKMASRTSRSMDAL